MPSSSAKTGHLGLQQLSLSCCNRSHLCSLTFQKNVCMAGMVVVEKNIVVRIKNKVASRYSLIEQCIIVELCYLSIPNARRESTVIKNCLQVTQGDCYIIALKEKMQNSSCLIHMQQISESYSRFQNCASQSLLGDI